MQIVPMSRQPQQSQSSNYSNNPNTGPNYGEQFGNLETTERSVDPYGFQERNTHRQPAQSLPAQSLPPQSLPAQSLPPQPPLQSLPQLLPQTRRAEDDSGIAQLRETYLGAISTYDTLAEVVRSERTAIDNEKRRVGMLISNMEREEDNLRTLVRKYNDLVLNMSEIQDRHQTSIDSFDALHRSTSDRTADRKSDEHRIGELRIGELRIDIDSRMFDDPLMSKYTYNLEEPFENATKIELIDYDFEDMRYNIWSDFRLTVICSDQVRRTVDFEMGRWTVYDLMEHFNSVINRAAPQGIAQHGSTTQNSTQITMELDERFDRLRVCSTNQPITLENTSFWKQLGFDQISKEPAVVIEAHRSFDLRISKYIQLYLYNLDSQEPVARLRIGEDTEHGSKKKTIKLAHPQSIGQLVVGILDDLHQRPVRFSNSHTLGFMIK